MRLHTAMLFVNDLPRMAAFYSQVMGLKQIGPASETASWVEFDAGGSRFALHAIPAHIAAEYPIADPPEPREEYPTKLIFSVTDVEAEHQRLAGLGVRFLDRPWGGHDAIDPEGNVFALVAEVEG